MINRHLKSIDLKAQIGTYEQAGPAAGAARRQLGIGDAQLIAIRRHPFRTSGLAGGDAEFAPLAPLL